MSRSVQARTMWRPTNSGKGGDESAAPKVERQTISSTYWPRKTTAAAEAPRPSGRSANGGRRLGFGLNDRTGDDLSVHATNSEPAEGQLVKSSESRRGGTQPPLSSTKRKEPSELSLACVYAQPRAIKGRKIGLVLLPAAFCSRSGRVGERAGKQIRHSHQAPRGGQGQDSRTRRNRQKSVYSRPISIQWPFFGRQR